jgi:hypothetical protein
MLAITRSPEPFNPAHPPLMTDPNILPATETQSEKVGDSLEVDKSRFDLVVDPKYPWESMPIGTPNQFQERAAVKQRKLTEVNGYKIQRSRKWYMTGRKTYAADETDMQMITKGVNYSHHSDVDDSITTRIGLDLGLELDGDLFADAAEVAAKRPKGVKLAENDNSQGLSGQFTEEMSRTLSFRQSDSSTFEQRTELQQTVTFKANTQYLHWQLQELVTVKRILSDGTEQLVSSLVANSAVTYDQAFPMGDSGAL